MTIIACPCCEGSGKRYDTETAEWTDDVCTACQGSKVLETDRQYWQVRNQRASSISWRDMEVEYLKRFRQKGLTYKRISVMLDRTPGAIQSKVMYLKKHREWIDSDTIRIISACHSLWTDRETEIVKQMKPIKVTIEELRAEGYIRTYKSIDYKRGAIRKAENDGHYC